MLDRKRSQNYSTVGKNDYYGDSITCWTCSVYGNHQSSPEDEYYTTTRVLRTVAGGADDERVPYCTG